MSSSSSSSTTATLTLMDLPVELLRRIVIFAGSDVHTVLQVERTCQAFRAIVADDVKIWKNVPPVSRRRQVAEPHGVFQGCATFRMRTSILACLNYIRREQKSCDNVLIHVLGVDGWKALLDQIFDEVLPHVDPRIDVDANRVFFRNDTLGILAELTQHAMINLFALAGKLSCTIAKNTGQYPLVTAQVYQDELVCGSPLHSHVIPRPQVQFTEFDNFDYDGLLQEELRNKILLRLSRRAGIVRMTNQVHELSWQTICRLLVFLIRPVILELIEHNERDRGEDCEGKRQRRVLGLDETHYEVPPLTKLHICEHCGIAHIVTHTPVPSQIEHAARIIGISEGVYGSLWCLDSKLVASETAEEVREEVVEDYVVEEESDDDESFTWFNENDDTSMCIEDIEGEDGELPAAWFAL